MSAGEKRPSNIGRSGDRGNADGGLVEKLLRAAGPGPEIPDGGAGRVQASIRGAWREQVGVARRQRRRLWAGGLAAAAAVALAVIVIPILVRGPAPQPHGAMVLARIQGEIELTEPGSRAQTLGPDDAGRTVTQGSLVATADGDRAALELGGGHTMRLDQRSAVRLSSEVSLALVTGAVYVSSAPEALSAIEVRTPLGIVTDIGTQFEVRLESETLAIRVREGAVVVDRDGDEYHITHGVMVTIADDGSVSTDFITPYDAAWDWTQEIAPGFDIDGRSALAYLDWFSSETGLSVRFAAPEAERAAAETLLHGSIEGLPPADTPDAVLPACGLAAIKEFDTLVVMRSGSSNDGPW